MQTPAFYRTDPHSDSELIDGLEPDQIVGNASKPLPRMHIGKAGAWGFWLLRIFVLLISAMVVYTFIVNLPGSG